MTQRGASGSVITELAKDQNQPFHLFEFYFDSGTLRFTNSGFDITWGGYTYTNSANLISFSGIEETTDIQTNGVDFVLSGVSDAIIALVASEDFVDRRATIYQGFLDTSNAVVADPFLIFDGRMDEVKVAEDPMSGTCGVSVNAANQFIDFDRVNGRKTNPSSQKEFFPADKGFNFVASLKNKKLRWGV